MKAISRSCTAASIFASSILTLLEKPTTSAVETVSPVEDVVRQLYQVGIFRLQPS